MIIYCNVLVVQVKYMSKMQIIYYEWFELVIYFIMFIKFYVELFCNDKFYLGKKFVRELVRGLLLI